MRLAPAVSTQLQFEQASPTLLYLGEAPPGVATSAPSWRIMQIDTSVGVRIKYADNSGFFNKVWDDRTTYTYG